MVPQVLFQEVFTLGVCTSCVDNLRQNPHCYMQLIFLEPSETNVQSLFRQNNFMKGRSFRMFLPFVYCHHLQTFGAAKLRCSYLIICSQVLTTCLLLNPRSQQGVWSGHSAFLTSQLQCSVLTNCSGTRFHCRSCRKTWRIF